MYSLFKTWVSIKVAISKLVDDSSINFINTSIGLGRNNIFRRRLWGISFEVKSHVEVRWAELQGSRLRKLVCLPGTKPQKPRRISSCHVLVFEELIHSTAIEKELKSFAMFYSLCVSYKEFHGERKGKSPQLSWVRSGSRLCFHVVLLSSLLRMGHPLSETFY